MKLENHDKEHVMNDSDQSQHADEVQKRWGDTPAYKESARRTKKYGDEDWARINALQEAIEASLAEALTAGADADSEQASNLAEEARLHIDRWFYPCSHAMHAGLADMYTADERFKAHYESRVEGLAEYVAAAIKANAARQVGEE
jgi:hypothetical protein